MLLIVQGLCANLAPSPRPFGLFAVADGLHGPQGKSMVGHDEANLAGGEGNVSAIVVGIQ